MLVIPSSFERPRAGICSSTCECSFLMASNFIIVITIWITNMPGQSFVTMLPIIKPGFGEDFTTKTVCTSKWLKKKAMETISLITRLTIFYPIKVVIPCFWKPPRSTLLRKVYNWLGWTFQKIRSSHLVLNIRMIFWNLFPKTGITHYFIRIKHILRHMLLNLVAVMVVAKFLNQPKSFQYLKFKQFN